MKKLILSLCLLALAASMVLQAQDQGVPREVVAWIESEVAKCDTPLITDLHSPQEFFSNEKNARLVGYIKGYDPQAGATAGKITHHNMITGENLVSIIEIEPDGRFTSDVKITTPACLGAKINKVNIEFYLEPGQTLGIILDWEDFLEYLKKRDWRLSLPVHGFYGPLASVNEEFNEHKANQTFSEESIALDSREFAKRQSAAWKSQSDNLDELIQTKKISPKSADILRSRINSHNALAFFNYILYNEGRNRENYDFLRKLDSIKRSGYYDFLSMDFVNDPAFLVPSESFYVINRYEFADSQTEILNRLQNPSPAISFYDYLTKELKIKTKINPEDAAHFKRDYMEEYLNLKTSEEKRALSAEFKEKDSVFYKKFEREKAVYDEKYRPEPLSDLEIVKVELKLHDSTMKNMYHLQPNLIQDIVKVHRIQDGLKYLEKHEARELLDYAVYGFANPFMAAWAEKIYNEKFPSGGDVDGAYELPQGKAADIFKRIIDPFRGKVLIVDFWGTTCSPCVAEIKDSKKIRDAYKDNDRIAFIYITDESNSPQTAYDKFVAENSMPNSVRLSTDEWNYLSELFQISGIPHYTLITPDGRVAENKFREHFNDNYFKKLIARYFPEE